MLLPRDGPVVLFDGVCGLCTAAVKFIIRRDKRGHIRFAPLQSRLGRDVCERYGVAPGDFETIVLVERDTAFVESEAVLRIVNHLDGLWSALAILRVVPRRLRDASYRYLARRRYRWFDRLDACWVPTAELAKRFLEIGAAGSDMRAPSSGDQRPRSARWPPPPP